MSTWIGDWQAGFHPHTARCAAGYMAASWTSTQQAGLHASPTPALSPLARVGSAAVAADSTFNGPASGLPLDGSPEFVGGNPITPIFAVRIWLLLDDACRRGWLWIEARRKTQRRRSLRVVESVGMGEKRFVAIVQVEGARFLVGGGSAGVSLLARLEGESEFADVLAAQASGQPQSPRASLASERVAEPLTAATASAPAAQIRAAC